MKDFKVLKIIDKTMIDTGQRVAEIELSEVEYLKIVIPSNKQPYTFKTEGIKFYIDFFSELTGLIIQSARNQEIVSIDLSEFRIIRRNNNGESEEIYYHKNVTLVGYDVEPDNFNKRQVAAVLICMNCKIDNNVTVPIITPKESYVGVSEFKEILNSIEIDCSYCGHNGFAGDENKFELVMTTGLDEDLEPELSNHQKRQWFYNLDFYFQHYVKQIFDINIYENTGYAVDFYKCKFLLTKLFVIKHPLYNIGFYKTSAIVFQNGKHKDVEGKYSFMYQVLLDEELPEELIINPEDYSTEEKTVRIIEGGTTVMPLLVSKIM